MTKFTTHHFDKIHTHVKMSGYRGTYLQARKTNKIREHVGFLPSEASQADSTGRYCCRYSSHAAVCLNESKEGSLDTCGRFHCYQGSYLQHLEEFPSCAAWGDRRIGEETAEN